MSDPRIDWQNGHWSAQFFDVNDLFGNAYDYTFQTVTNIPIIFAARREWVFDADGIPGEIAVPGTDGPVGGLICWPPSDHSPRTACQWGFVFAARITQSAPEALMAQPVRNAAGPWTTDGDLAEAAVFTSDSKSPVVGTFGLVVAGTYLGKQELLFFQGGSGGSSMIAFRVASAVGAGIYNGVQIDAVLGTDLPGGITTARLQEMNLSTNVGTNSKVYAQKETSGGNDYYVFVLDMGVCV